MNLGRCFFWGGDFLITTKNDERSKMDSDQDIIKLPLCFSDSIRHFQVHAVLCHKHDVHIRRIVCTSIILNGQVW